LPVRVCSAHNRPDPKIVPVGTPFRGYLAVTAATFNRPCGPMYTLKGVPTKNVNDRLVSNVRPAIAPFGGKVQAGVLVPTGHQNDRNPIRGIRVIR